MIPGVFAAGAMGRGGGGSGWTPADLPAAPAIWLDWDSPITAVSGVCSEWENSKGSAGGAFVQSDSTFRPSVNPSAVVGRRVLEFDGINDRLEAATAGLRDLYRNTPSAWIMVIAARVVLGTANAQVLEASSGLQVTRFGVGAGFPGNPNWLVAGRRQDSGGASIVVAGRSDLDADFHILYGQIDFANAHALAALDGRAPEVVSPFLTPGLTDDTASLRINIGANAANNAFGHVSVAAVLSGSGSLPSLEDQQKLEGWAAWQCGLQAQLPVGHPYRNAPP